jgi:hypothetical protein
MVRWSAVDSDKDEKRRERRSGGGSYCPSSSVFTTILGFFLFWN